MESFFRKNSRKLIEDNDGASSMEHKCQMSNAPTKKKKRTKRGSQKFSEDVNSKEQGGSSTVAQEVSCKVPFLEINEFLEKIKLCLSSQIPNNI